MATKLQLAESKAKQAEALYDAASKLMEEAAQLEAEALAVNEVEAIPVKVPDWITERDYTQQRFGDARSANGKYFQWWIRERGDGFTDIEIFCPTFLRGGLSIEVSKNGQVGMGY